MDLIQNFKSILSDRNSGGCPFCGSKETDFSIITISDGMGYCDIGVTPASMHAIYQE